MNQEVVFQPFQLDGYECVAYHPKKIGSEQLPTVYLQDGKQVLNDLEEIVDIKTLLHSSCALLDLKNGPPT